MWSQAWLRIQTDLSCFQSGNSSCRSMSYYTFEILLSNCCQKKLRSRQPLGQLICRQEYLPGSILAKEIILSTLNNLLVLIVPPINHLSIVNSFWLIVTCSIGKMKSLIITITGTKQKYRYSFLNRIRKTNTAVNM